ncbi:MAG: glycosyl transferase family 1, partial [Chloroflexota bacterium]
MRRLIARFDACTVVSEVEKRWLVEIGVNPARIALIPNGVDLGWYSGVEAHPQADTLIFNGALTYFANYQAMAYFLERIYPLIRAECPQVRLAITGRTEGVALAALRADESVTFTG